MEVAKPAKGDLVGYFIQGRLNRYFACFEPDRVTHLGIYVGNDRVNSKFRGSHVYEHHLEDIPIRWGHLVKFFRGIPFKLEKDFWKNI